MIMTGLHLPTNEFWCVAMVHRTGGSVCPSGDTPELARVAAQRASERHPKAYVVASVPYPVKRASIPDVTVPGVVRKQWPLGTRMLYYRGGK